MPRPRTYLCEPAASTMLSPMPTLCSSTRPNMAPQGPAELFAGLPERAELQARSFPAQRAACQHRSCRLARCRRNAVTQHLPFSGTMSVREWLWHTMNGGNPHWVPQPKPPQAFSSCSRSVTPPLLVRPLPPEVLLKILLSPLALGAVARVPGSPGHGSGC